ncbi:sugar phosphate isomerase/epimerase family protein [Lignipirellula cremea]|uniref:Xylose isomerase-like TIM barrel n=1 Tax=Lignipirellula cremea TaxID=2528010 RepID=A0A518E171_9BACT|nr:sugar phosphate isomerase/epimerase family protein [Lignipirellula cremea]QDU97846.1 Xylose isomerase-like TIM barrel [Lignipirellula cremea]
MIDFGRIPRRGFLQGAAAFCAAQPLLALGAEKPATLQGRLYKTLKIGMVKTPGTLVEKFAAVKEAGFQGIELNAPGYDPKEVRHAIAETGLPVDGTVCASHWSVRHTDPDPAVRAAALKDLQQAIRDTHAVGGNTVLLVVGRGSDGPEKEIWPRSVDNISQALPLAAELGVYIAIENVWNQFLYDHEGDSNQTADKFVQYVDDFNSPWVGMQFDIGNHWKYGDAGGWIRTFGRRIVKLDLKGFSRKENRFTKIGEGDLDWAGVRAALLEINYTGWAAAEVGGGDLERLKEVSANMDVAFGLT